MDQTKALPPATQDYMAKKWTENGKYVDVDKVAFVSEGPIGLTIKANIEVPGAEIQNFDDLQQAIEWAKKK